MIGMKVDLQLVSSEAGPGSLGGFRLVNLLFSGHGPLHVHAGSCSNATILTLKQQYKLILLFLCVKCTIQPFRVSVSAFNKVSIFSSINFKKGRKKNPTFLVALRGNLQPLLL